MIPNNIKIINELNNRIKELRVSEQSNDRLKMECVNKNVIINNEISDIKRHIRNLESEKNVSEVETYNKY